MGGGVLDARQADMGKFGGDFDLSSGLVKIDVSGRGFRGIADVPTLGYLSHTYNSERGVTTVYDPYGSGFSVNFIGGSPDNSVNFSGNFIGFTTITGNDIANVLNGTTADEFIYGLGGDDRLFGNDGNDLLDGGAGIDQLTGGNGQDVFKFSALTDSVQANGKMDRIADFVEGIDKIDLTGLGFLGVTSSTPNVGQLKVSYDSYYKQTYVRDLAGSGFGFYLTGNHLGLTNADFVGLVPPGQILTGTAANNILNGGAGNDLINGLGGDDRLFGNDGNDLLDGGAGIDQLTGGNGQDVFKFSALTDSVQANGKMDRIADFVEGIDKIDLTGLGFTGVTTGVPMSGQLKLSYDSYYKQTYVRDFSAGTGFGFYMTGNHTALANSSFIGFVNAIAGMAAPSVTTNSIKDPTQPDFIIAANLM
jgi:Ca2+-binding RTX toxin-like protein